MGDRIHLLHSHDALLILRHSLSIPKILYILRSAPCFLSASLEAYDDLLRDILSDITNVCLEEDSVWAQASLPVRARGLGVQKASQLAPSAFLASAAGCFELVDRSSLLTCAVPLIQHWDWLSLSGSRVMMNCLLHPQSSIVRVPGTLLRYMPPMTLSWMPLLTPALELACWLWPPRSQGPGSMLHLSLLWVSTWMMMSSVLLWGYVLVSRCVNPTNVATAKPMWSTHGLSCRFSMGRFAQHAVINDIIKRSFDAVKIRNHLEPTGLYRSDGQRPLSFLGKVERCWFGMPPVQTLWHLPTLPSLSRRL